MPQHITTHVHELVAAAEREIETLAADAAVALHGRDDVILVDLRDIRELGREGRVPGAFHCPRGMLEFWIDPASKYHKPVFAADKRFVFFCAAGQRSALAAQTAQRMSAFYARLQRAMGLAPVAHIAGRLRRLEGGRRAGRGTGRQAKGIAHVPKARSRASFDALRKWTPVRRQEHAPLDGR